MNPDLATRLLGGLMVNAALAGIALMSGTVCLSGALVGLGLGTLITVSLGWSGLAVLAGFFVLGSLLTRWGYSAKRSMGVAEARGGARGVSHALANAGFPTLFAMAAWLSGNPLWTVAFVGSFATAAMDTAGSELGPLYGRRTISLKTGHVVAPGTEGAVSIEGTLGGLVAAATLGALALGIDLLPSRGVILWILLGAMVGNLYEGMAGSRRLLPHAWLNATNTFVGGGVAALCALAWS